MSVYWGDMHTYHISYAAYGLEPVTEGRIGLRHMYTRSARYRDFRLSALSN